MSITLTPLPNATPPRIQISLSSTSGAAITAATLSRVSQGSTVPTRFQPTAGPSPRIVNDYEADWDANVVYSATVTTAGGTETFTSSATMISPAVAWLIHPATPALSRVLDAGTTDAMGIVSLGAVSRPATTTAHDIIGSKYRVITKSGPRAASRLQMVVATVTPLEQQALWAILDDQTPLLIRVPAVWGWDWENGYYDVGQVDSDRVVQYGPIARRAFTLPLERVEAPAGTQQAERTWADVLTGFTKWADLPPAYLSWTDLLTNTRR